MDKELAVIRKETASKKWGRYGKEDILPFWIADMDFPSPDFLVRDLIDRAQKNYFGYTDLPAELKQQISFWYEKRHQLKIKSESILFSTSVLNSYASVIRACLNKEGKIAVFTPLYPPLMKIAETLGHPVVEFSLIEKNDYRINFDLLAKTLAEDPLIEAIVFCNPHNPLGKVWKAEEIETLIKIAEAAAVYLISDEIHSDLTYLNETFSSVLTEKNSSFNKKIILSSPAKTFNVAGLKASYLIIENADLRKKIAAALKADGFSDLDLFAAVTLSSLYGRTEESLAWLHQLLERIEKNACWVEQRVEQIPRCSMTPVQASYLAWLKVENSPLSSDEIRRSLKDQYGIDLHEGSIFRGDGDQHIRLNFGCPLEMLMEGLDRLERAILEKVI